MLLVQAIRSNASFRASEIATIDGEEQRTWEEFVDRVARAADGFRQMGARPGDRIGILALNSARYLRSAIRRLVAGWGGRAHEHPLVGRGEPVLHR